MTRQFFLSDTHFTHKNILKFERTQFATIEEHDEFLVRMYRDLAKKMCPGDTVYHLGDWGNIEFLWVNDILRERGAKTVLVMGNHDRKEYIPEFQKYFDEVHEYGIFLTNRVLLSHRPYMLAEPGVLNVCGHLHGSTLNSRNHLVVSLEAINYKPVNNARIEKLVGQLPSYNTRFLEESYAPLYKFSQKRNNSDVITDADGNIDYTSTVVMRKLKESLKEASDNADEHANERRGQ